MHQEKTCPVHCGNAVGLFFVLLFVLCFLRYALFPVETELHLQLLRLSYFGFSGMNPMSFVLAAVQSYIAGYVVVGLWMLVGCCLKTCGCCKEEGKK